MRSYHRYNQSPASTTAIPNKEKLNLTRSSFIQGVSSNPQRIVQTKLPSINTYRRSGSLSAMERNSKFKLQNIEQKLQELKADVVNTRLDAQETLSHIRFLRQNLVDGELTNYKQDLRKQVKGLERLVNNTISSDGERYTNLRKDCNDLWNQTQELRQTLFELRMKTDHLDTLMGYK